VVLLLITVVVLLIFMGLSFTNLKSDGNSLFHSEPIWQFEAKDTFVGTPLVFQNQAIVRSNNGVYILDVNTGSELGFVKSRGWSSEVRPPQICGNTLLIPEAESKLLAVSISTMNIIWEACPSSQCGPDELFQPIETIACSGNIAVVARYNQQITAYELANGNII
jgi:hypothetical protein